jgi:hypothetical protein
VRTRQDAPQEFVPRADANNLPTYDVVPGVRPNHAPPNDTVEMCRNCNCGAASYASALHILNDRWEHSTHTRSELSEWLSRSILSGSASKHLQHFIRTGATDQRERHLDDEPPNPAVNTDAYRRRFALGGRRLP